MNFDEYQQWTRTTAIYPEDRALAYLVTGLCSEAGEVAGKYKKAIRDGGFDVMGLVDEVGDVLWYAARIADELNMDMTTVLQRNKEKLEDRKARAALGGNGDQR